MTRALVWAAVGGLGGVGACARVWLDVEVSRRLRWAFPLGTMAVNVSGAFVLGVLAGAGVAGDAELIAGTAVLGSFTTFSTWMLESERLGQLERARLAWCNVGVSLAAGLAAVALGRALGGLL